MACQVRRKVELRIEEPDRHRASLSLLPVARVRGLHMSYAMSRMLPSLVWFRCKQAVVLPAQIKTGSRIYHVYEVPLDYLHRGAEWRSLFMRRPRKALYQSYSCSTYRSSRHAGPLCLRRSALYASKPRESALSVMTCLWRAMASRGLTCSMLVQDACQCRRIRQRS